MRDGSTLFDETVSIILEPAKVLLNGHCCKFCYWWCGFKAKEVAVQLVRLVIEGMQTLNKTLNEDAARYVVFVTLRYLVDSS